MQRLVLSIVIFCSALLLVKAGHLLISRWLSIRLGKKAQYYDAKMEALFLTEVSPRKTAILADIGIFAAGILGYFLTGSLFFALIFAIIGFYAPTWILKKLKEKRLERFNEQLVDVLNSITDSVRANPSLVEAFKDVANRMVPPASEEFGLLVKRWELGMTVEQSLDILKNKIDNDNLNLFIVALLIHKEKGGALPELLENISRSIREIARLEQKILTMTAEARFASKTMVLIPVIVLFMYFLFDPENMLVVFSDPIGYVILIIAAIFTALGFFGIKKVVDVDI